MTNDEVKLMLQQQSNITCFEIATFCATLCDMHKGCLFVGDLIRKQFNLEALEKSLPKREPNEIPTPVLEPEAVITSTPVSSNPTPPKKVSSIVRTK